MFRLICEMVSQCLVSSNPEVDKHDLTTAGNGRVIGDCQVGEEGCRYLDPQAIHKISTRNENGKPLFVHIQVVPYSRNSTSCHVGGRAPSPGG